MKRDEILAALFGPKHRLKPKDGIVIGEATLAGHGPVHVLGVTDATPLGVDQALALAGRVLDIAASKGDQPIVVVIDSSSQRMSRRDELLGLNEYLAHLAKSFLLAEASGHRSIGVLYGGSAAGAFIATALSCGTLAALPDAHPAVMDLPSMARVTKLPVATLEKMSRATPVFAPGVDNLVLAGAVGTVLDPKRSLAEQVAALLAQPAAGDVRAALGKKRGGRKQAFDIAATVKSAAMAHR